MFVCVHVCVLAVFYINIPRVGLIGTEHGTMYFRVVFLNIRLFMKLCICVLLHNVITYPKIKQLVQLGGEWRLSNRLRSAAVTQFSQHFLNPPEFWPELTLLIQIQILPKLWIKRRVKQIFGTRPDFSAFCFTFHSDRAMANLKFVSAVSFLRIVLVLVLVDVEKSLSCRVL